MYEAYVRRTRIAGDEHNFKGSGVRECSLDVFELEATDITVEGLEKGIGCRAQSPVLRSHELDDPNLHKPRV